MKIDENSDNTVNFTDYNHTIHGVSEIVNVGGEEYIVVIWAKDSANSDNNDLISPIK